MSWTKMVAMKMGRADQIIDKFDTYYFKCKYVKGNSGFMCTFKVKFFFPYSLQAYIPGSQRNKENSL